MHSDTSQIYQGHLKVSLLHLGSGVITVHIFLDPHKSCKVLRPHPSFPWFSYTPDVVVVDVLVFPFKSPQTTE